MPTVVHQTRLEVLPSLCHLGDCFFGRSILARPVRDRRRRNTGC